MGIIKTKYYYAQDGEYASDEIKRIFELDEEELIRNDEEKKSRFKIVGFIFKNQNVLVIFPKHFYDASRIDELNSTHSESEEDINLLFNVIKKYREIEKSKARAGSYLGAIDDDKFYSDYPFAEFFEIYDYFKKFGLYRENEHRVLAGGNGKVSWKHTISKSQKILCNNNLFFVPIYYNVNYSKNVFVTECMAFVIDYTLEFFHSFFSMKNTGFKNNYFDYFNNIDYVIGTLQKYEKELFKDSEKKLINSLKNFFVKYKEKANSGCIHVKISYFDKIWESMINQYLNRHFAGIDKYNNSAIFDKDLDKSNYRFKKQSFHVDISAHNYTIEVDHISYTKPYLYIFDSKYYESLSELNYKQFAYGELLRSHPDYREMSDLFNILILPGRKKADKHFALNSSLISDNRPYSEIVEQYLEPKELMIDYLK